MTDQNTQIVPNIGDIITADQIVGLPVGAIVTDRDGDSYRQNDNGTWSRNFDTPDEYVVNTHSDADGIRGYFGAHFTPYTLRSLPARVKSTGQPDLYQQARLALRDRYGVEPSSADVDTVQQIMEDSKLDASAAVGALGLSRAGVIPSPATAPQLVAGFGIAVSGGGAAAAETVDTDDTVKGLARLRAHAALDRILDQMGISR